MGDSTKIKITHVAYADESKHNFGRYRSIALVSLSIDHAPLLQKNLGRILKKHECDEMKWFELRTDYDLRVVKECFKEVYEYIRLGLLRCDILTWDIEDSRHKLGGRNDSANLARMYYHLFKNVLIVRWPNESIWGIYPDENSALEWNKIKECLDNKSFSISQNGPLLSIRDFGLLVRNEFEIFEIQEQKSCDQPLIQVADILAGVSAFSREKFEKYCAWNKTISNQQDIFENSDNIQVQLSNSEKRRFPFLKELRDFAAKNKFRVSLDSSGGLRTFDPRFPLNFWFYMPQSESDKAPRG